MPPRVAPLQVIVIPIPAANLTDAQRAELSSTTADLVAQLKKAGVRVQCDDRDNYRPGWKYNHWEVKVRTKVIPSVPAVAMPAGTRMAAHHRSWGSMSDEDVYHVQRALPLFCETGTLRHALCSWIFVATAWFYPNVQLSWCRVCRSGWSWAARTWRRRAPWWPGETLAQRRPSCSRMWQPASLLFWRRSRYAQLSTFWKS